MESSLFLKCDCETEGLEFKYLSAENNIDEIYVSFWQFGYGTVNLWQRLKWMFYILRKGTIYGDQVILNKDKILELQKWLTDLEVKK